MQERTSGLQDLALPLGAIGERQGDDLVVLRDVDLGNTPQYSGCQADGAGGEPSYVLEDDEWPVDAADGVVRAPRVGRVLCLPNGRHRESRTCVNVEGRFFCSSCESYYLDGGAEGGERTEVGGRCDAGGWESGKVRDDLAKLGGSVAHGKSRTSWRTSDIT